MEEEVKVEIPKKDNIPKIEKNEIPNNKKLSSKKRWNSKKDEIPTKRWNKGFF